MSNENENGFIVGSLYHALRGGTWGLSNMPSLIKEAISDRIWEGWVDIHTQQRYSQPDFMTFVTTPVLEGLGATIDQIKALCEKDLESLKMIDDEITRKRGGANNPYGCKGKDEGINNDNIMIDSPPEQKATQGTSIEYTLRRLRKGHPELHEKVLANELSPNAAAIEAGFRKPTWTAPANVEDLAVAIRKRFTQDERQQIMEIWSKS